MILLYFALLYFNKSSHSHLLRDCFIIETIWEILSLISCCSYLTFSSNTFYSFCSSWTYFMFVLFKSVFLRLRSFWNFISFFKKLRDNCYGLEVTLISSLIFFYSSINFSFISFRFSTTFKLMIFLKVWIIPTQSSASIGSFFWLLIKVVCTNEPVGIVLYLLNN